MARIALPPPPKSRGLTGLLIGLVMVGGAVYIFSNYQGPPVSAIKPPVAAAPGQTFMEIDLRGPQYDEGRHEGFLRGQAALGHGLQTPADTVLGFQASEMATKAALDSAQTDDFVAGYKSGFGEGMRTPAKAKIKPVPL